MKIVVLNGSPRKKDSYNIIKTIQNTMCTQNDIQFEIIHISKEKISPCVGCMQCFQVSEKNCPLKDSIENIKSKLVSADGIILASPVYAINVSGEFKILIDRLSYLFHRPELVGKPFLNITTTAGGGDRETLKYLKLISVGWGGRLIGDLSVISPTYFKEYEFFNEEYHNKINRKINHLCEHFLQSLSTQKVKSPTLYEVLSFHALKSKTYTSKADYDYWENRGWLKASYYYPVRVNPLYNSLGKLLSHMIKRSFQKKYNTKITREV